MAITRRDFMKYCIASAVVLGLDGGLLGKVSKALAAGGPTVVWLNGASCTGCTTSLANLISTTDPTDIGDLLINHIGLTYNTTLMGAAGDLAVNTLKTATTTPFILAVEGGIPTSFAGHSCVLWSDGGREVTALEAVRDLAGRSLANIAIGTCASFGGIPAASPNPTGILSLKAATAKTVINIPGCPTHPDWVVWVIAQLLAGRSPALDLSGRPAALFQGESKKVHEKCSREDMDEVRVFGKVGCLKELGCKGPKAQGDCPVRLWNNKTNWCVGANSICLACTENGFPDRFSPFYRRSGI